VDADAAARAGVPLLHADGAASAEAALGVLTSDAMREAILCTSVAAEPLERVGPCVSEAAARMRVDVLLLRWSADGEALGLEAAYEAVRAHACKLGVRWVGVQCENAKAAPRCVARLLAAGERPALLALPLHAASGKWQRALLGLCRRSGVRVLALNPTGCEALAAAPAVVTAAASRACAPAYAVADALLAWCIGRECVALPAAFDVNVSLEHVASLATCRFDALDLTSAQRAALDAAGDALAEAAMC
jgi:diketogulonate reductase-like aldo/keto reductase